MSPAELPERPRAGADGSESERAVPGAMPASTSSRRDTEIDRLQARLDQLESRIQAALPDGYNLDELVKASGEGHESEEVYEITGELAALERLAGPLIVPGMTPPPAFDDDTEVESFFDESQERTPTRAVGRWTWIALIIVVLVAAAAGSAVLLGYL